MSNEDKYCTDRDGYACRKKNMIIDPDGNFCDDAELCQDEDNDEKTCFHKDVEGNRHYCQKKKLDEKTGECSKQSCEDLFYFNKRNDTCYDPTYKCNGANYGEELCYCKGGDITMQNAARKICELRDPEQFLCVPGQVINGSEGCLCTNIIKVNSRTQYKQTAICRKDETCHDNWDRFVGRKLICSQAPISRPASSSFCNAIDQIIKHHMSSSQSECTKKTDALVEPEDIGTFYTNIFTQENIEAIQKSDRQWTVEIKENEPALWTTEKNNVEPPKKDLKKVVTMDLIGTFSSNTFKFRITPSPTNNAEKSFVKRIDHFSFVRTCDKLMEMYPFIMAYAKQHETAHLLQEHEYCGKMGNKVEDGVQREWLATKWVEGKSLEKINVEGQKIEWPGRDAEETFRLVRQLFQAMAAFHCVGFQHGDLHSNNISIDTQNNIRIIDYDLAGRIPNDWAKSTEKGHMVQAIKILLGLHQKFWQSEEFRRLYSYNTHPIQPRCKKGDENVERMECFLSNLESYIGFSVLDGRPKYCKLFEKGDLTVEKMFHAKCFTHVRET
jgi:hypothetical protein